MATDIKASSPQGAVSTTTVEAPAAYGGGYVLTIEERKGKFATAVFDKQQWLALLWEMVRRL